MLKKEPGPLEVLAMECLSDSRRWFPNIAHSLPHHTLSLAGEVGELANLIKKVERGDYDLRDATVRHKLAMEATDVFIYLLNIAALLNIDLEKAYRIKRTENENRFGNGRK